MNFRTTLLLIALLVAVAGFSLYWRSSQKPGSGATTGQTTRMKAFSAEELAGVTIQSGTDTLSLARDGDRWRITAPFAAAADTFEVDTFISRALLLPTEIAAGAGGGFVPVVTVGLQARSGETRSVEFSQPTATGDVFVRSAGATSVVSVGPTSMDWMTDLRGLAGRLRSRQLVDAASNDIERVVIRGGGGTIDLQHGAQGWRVVRPFEALADENAVTELLLAVTGLRATGFPAGVMDTDGITIELYVSPLETSALPGTAALPKVLTVKIGGFQDIRRQTVLVTVTGDGSDGALAAVPAASLEGLRVSAIALKSKAVVTIPAVVRRVRIMRAEDGAQVDWPAAGATSSLPLAELLAAGRPLQAVRYLEALPVGRPAYRVTFVTDEQTISIDLHSPGAWVGVYNGIAFELPASVGSLVEQIFAPPAPAAATPQESK